MNRRKFLKSLMVGTAGIAAAPLMVSIPRVSRKSIADELNRIYPTMNVTMTHSHDGIYFGKIDPTRELTRYIRLNFIFQNTPQS